MVESGEMKKGLPLNVFTVLLVLVLFAGIVLLMGEGVSSLKGRSGASPFTEEGARLMEDIEALTECTRVINNILPCAGSRSYDFLSDIDGDGRTGLYGIPGGQEGLERVVIYRSSEKSRELRVDVYAGPGQRPRSTVLTRDLDSNDPHAFGVDCTYGSPAKNGEPTGQESRLHESLVRISVSLTLGPHKGEATGGQSFREVIRLKALVRENNRSLKHSQISQPTSFS
ncbi:MAG: hypothetical protein JJE48_08765 [Actinobacteria bacterium]|nr:hypothetical protein [Actinomycetota bacterium]